MLYPLSYGGLGTIDVALTDAREAIRCRPGTPAGPDSSDQKSDESAPQGYGSGTNVALRQRCRR